MFVAAWHVVCGLYNLGLRRQSNLGVWSGERVMGMPEVGGVVLSFSIELLPPAIPVGALYIQLRNSLLGNLDVFGSFVYSLAEPTVVPVTWEYVLVSV